MTAASNEPISAVAPLAAQRRELKGAAALFQIGSQVVHPDHGIGRVGRRVPRRFNEVEAGHYYEIVYARGPVWVLIETGLPYRLRPLTRRSDLGHYRRVLRGRPGPLPLEGPQRQAGLRDQLQTGSFQGVCAVVRDLTAHGRGQSLGKADSVMLEEARGRLCQEWAAANQVTLAQAAEEIQALLRAGRRDSEA